MALKRNQLTIAKSLLITVICVLISVLFTTFIFIIFRLDRVGFKSVVYISITAPIVLTPVITIYLLNLIDELRITRDLLEKASRTDFLTEIFNRRYIIELLENAFLSGQRYKFPFSLILIDLDHFKKINDKYGHDAGDYVLKNFSWKILNNIRRTDYFGRFGGEEFLLVCMHTSLNNAEVLAGKLKHIIENTQFFYKDTKIKVTASFGLSSNEGQVDNVNRLLKLTDEALYDAKRAGRNCIKKRI